jgi:hypothetical protein
MSRTPLGRQTRNFWEKKMEAQTTKFKDPWGFSKWDSFNGCPAKFKYTFVEKRKEGNASSPAMERGSKMHDNIESYLNGWAKDLIKDNEGFREAFDALKLKDYHAEQAMGIDKDWNHLPDWFDKRTWLRVKMDAYFVEDNKGTAIDFKSGKYRVPSVEQVELYAIALHAKIPTLTEVTAEFWYLDTGEIYDRTYTPEQLLQLRKKYEGYATRMYNEVLFTPSPSNGCRWCAFSKTKGGPCKY